jgi:hypothetical protein
MEKKSNIKDVRTDTLKGKLWEFKYDFKFDKHNIGNYIKIEYCINKLDNYFIFIYQIKEDLLNDVKVPITKTFTVILLNSGDKGLEWKPKTSKMRKPKLCIDLGERDIFPIITKLTKRDFFSLKNKYEKLDKDFLGLRHIKKEFEIVDVNTISIPKCKVCSNDIYLFTSNELENQDLLGFKNYCNKCEIIVKKIEKFKKDKEDQIINDLKRNLTEQENLNKFLTEENSFLKKLILKN